MATEVKTSNAKTLEFIDNDKNEIKFTYSTVIEAERNVTMLKVKIEMKSESDACANPDNNMFICVEYGEAGDGDNGFKKNRTQMRWVRKPNDPRLLGRI